MRNPDQTRMCRLVVPLLLLWAFFGCATSTAAAALSLASEDEAIWAIRCDTLRGHDRVQAAKKRAEALKRIRGLKAKLVQVVHTDQESIVYYGRYRRQHDPIKQTTHYRPDPLPDLELIRSLSMKTPDPTTGAQRDIWPFIYATLEELPTGKQQNPEWDLSRADGYWSLHVAVFYNEGPITNRKFLAQEYCRELRKEKKVEAYYHHGPVRSSVYIGLFPKEAVQNMKEIDPLTGVPTFKNKIVDEKLLALQRKFPYSYQNGKKVNELMRDRDSGEIIRIPFKSFIVKVPRAEQAEKGLGDGG